MEQITTKEAGAVVKLLYTMEEAAEALSLSRVFLYELVMTKQVASIKIGRARRVPLTALQAFIERQLQVA